MADSWGEETNPEFEGYFIHVTNGDRIPDNTGEKPKRVRVPRLVAQKVIVFFSKQFVMEGIIH